MSAQTRQIMVVEDLDSLREVVTMGLRALGYDVIAASHGADALARLHEGVRPSLILLDQTMPVMDGPTMLGHLVAHHELRRIPVVICSSDLPPSTGPLAAAYKHFLRKPFDVYELQDVIERYATDFVRTLSITRTPNAGHLRRRPSLRCPFRDTLQAFDASLRQTMRAKDLCRRARLERERSAHLRGAAIALRTNRIFR
jgi:CheY-like chemotaxis protein